jgi:methionyl-tRNA formyltransferase
MTDPRVVFLGNDRWSVPSLELLRDRGPQPVLVLTRTPRPAGRGSKLRATAVARSAVESGLQLLEVETVRSGPGLHALREARPDVVVVVAYGEILPLEILQLPPMGCVNLHFSLLPRWRGAAPVQRAILAGDQVTGVTVMVMDEGLDTGPVLSAVEEVVRSEDDAASLGARLATIGATALRASILELPEGRRVAVPQPREGVTFAPKLTAEERRIEWSHDADAIARQVRALAPTPGASTRFRGEGLKVLGGRPSMVRTTSDPGWILLADEAGVSVATGDGSYRIEEVAPAGRRRMAAGAWALGARFQPGERLG